jgi:hypothetical protein
MNNGELLTANPAGHTLVDKLEEVLKDNKALEKQVVALEKQVVALEKQVVALEKQVVALTEGNKTLTRRSDDLMQASSDLRAIRNRFLDQYRQHKQSLPFKLVRSSIRAGNRAAHDPDIIFDALLYVNRHRSDPDTFKSLYGITPTKALDIRKYPYPLNHEYYTNLIRRQRAYVYHLSVRSICKEGVGKNDHRKRQQQVP